MNVLYSFLGVGNGRAARALELVPQLRKRCSLTLASSGRHVEVRDQLPLDITFAGLGFYFGRTGGIDYKQTAQEVFGISRFVRDVRSLDLTRFDLVINDCEPVTAYAARRSGTPMLAMSHQYSFSSPRTPRATPRNRIHEAIMSVYAPAERGIGFHFESYEPWIETPIIRQAVRSLTPVDEEYVTVYLPAYDEVAIIDVVKHIREVRWEIFSKHTLFNYDLDGIRVRKINSQRYLESLERCSGLLTGGGFEGPAEARYLGKRLFVIPQRGQYEQQCNAEALRLLGAHVAHRFDDRIIPQLREWLRTPSPKRRMYDDNTERVVSLALECQHQHAQAA